MKSAADRFSSEARARLEDPDPTAMAKTRRKKRRTHLDQNAGREAPGGKGDIPKSFVIKRGKMSELVKELTEDVRHVMEPHTAKNLKESKTNKLKDFVQVAGPLGVSHFIILSATENSKYVKIAKTPRCNFTLLRCAEHETLLENRVQRLQPTGECQTTNVPK